MKKISVCHVVNAVGDTSMPADIATKQLDHEAIEMVGVLAWFNADSFRHCDRIQLSVLDIPAGQQRISVEQYHRVKNILSGFDVIHTHHPHSGFFGKILAKRLNKPVVTTEHNNHEGYSRIGRITNGLTNFLVDEVVCVSESVHQSFNLWEQMLLRERKVRTIPNGINLERLKQAQHLDWSVYDAADIDPNSILVGSAGMLTDQKAHEILIEGVDQANEKMNSPIELVISGEGKSRTQLERQISQSRYPTRLHLLGFLKDREHVYKMMDEINIYAMPSRWEGLCVAALEAMALGNPCIFSDIDAFSRPFRELALFHPVNDPETLSNRLCELLEDEEMRSELGKKAKKAVENRYSLTVTADAYVDLYHSVL